MPWGVARDSASRWHEQALRHREGAPPLERASSLVDLAYVAVLLGDLEAAGALAERARGLVEREAPRSHALAWVLGLQGLVEEKRGDILAHERLESRAAALLEEIDPTGRSTSAALHNLGDVLRRRGHLARAEDLYRRALSIKSRFAPDRRMAYTLLSLAHVERARGELAEAAATYERALVLVRAHGPDATAEAALQLALGDTALEQGDQEGAAGRFAAALEAYRKVAPLGSGVGASLSRLGDLARRKGRFEEARGFHREALALAERTAPRGAEAARALFHMAEVSLDEGRAGDAERLLVRAASLYERAAPGGVEHAEALHRLALALWRGGRAAAAEPPLSRATALLDAAQEQLGGTELAAARFHARYLRIYRDRMELLLALGRPQAGFDALERSRAVALRRMLRQRGPARAAARSPDGHAAALGESVPLTTAAAAAALPPGTVVLSFAVGRDATRVFVLRRDGLRVQTLGVGEEALRRDVERLRLLLAAPGPGAEPREGVLSRARALYGDLLGPLERFMESSERLLIVPDGPLHLLPFAALVRSDERGEPRYLAEWKPHSTAASVTAGVVPGRQGPAGSAREAVAFGDPAPSAAGRDLGALPASRGEAAAVAAQFRGARAFVGVSATEGRAKALAPAAGILHFAVHGIVDDQRPMDSGLVLAAGDSAAEDGFLQAWEVVQGVRLGADLVTLSGCDTALGAAVPGEGIVGLAGAFQYAGARSVLASLWKVSDRSTADLMEGFYKRLAEGASAPEALRDARLDLLRSPRTAHPFHWAAFELMGAPR